MKLCEYCNQPFEPKSRNQRFCNRTHEITCPVCGSRRNAKSTEQLSSILKTGPTACSYKCRVKRTQATSLERYGCKAPGNNPDARKKASQTMMDNLGVPHAMMNSDVRKKSAESLISKYGVDNAAKSQELLEKRMQTNKSKYGDTLPFNRPESYEKQHATILARYGVKYATDLPWVKNWNGHISQLNRNFGSMLDKLNITYNYELYLSGKYFDIYVPDKNLLIEINPTYTHSSVSHYNIPGLYPYYHRDKSQLAWDSGYRCIHVWDWDDWSKVVGAYFPKVKVKASEFNVYRLNVDACNEFLDKNDLRGRCRGQVLCIGLVKDDEIYQVITFGKSKFNKEYPMQIYRMATRLGYEIEGGYDLLSHEASRLFGIDRVIAYCDLSKSDGSIHESIGMTLLRTNPPAKIWSKGTEYIHDSLVRSSQTSYSESSLLDAGYLPIYDCGHRVYVFK